MYLKANFTKNIFESQRAATAVQGRAFFQLLKAIVKDCGDEGLEATLLRSCLPELHAAVSKMGAACDTGPLIVSIIRAVWSVLFKCVP